MSKNIFIVCKECEKQFFILIKEHKRRIKNGHYKFFCSRSCSTKHRNRNSPNTPPIQWGNSHSKKGNFTYFLRRAFQRKQHKFDLTDEYLAELWNVQNGRCALSGIEIHIPKDVMNSTKNSQLTTASLDRIDSTQGYIKGNVQFLARAINLAKNKHSDDEMKKFLTLLRT